MVEHARAIGEPSESVDVRDQRKALFGILAHVLTVSRGKFDVGNATNGDRQKWARIIIAGVEAYANLLKTVELESMEERIKLLEERRIEDNGEESQQPSGEVQTNE